MKIFGFNRLEIIIAAVIIIIASIFVVSNLKGVLNSANEKAARKNINALRSAVALYYSDNNGSYPGENIVQEISIAQKYINKIPAVHLSGHKKSSAIAIMKGSSDKNLDTGGWAYKADSEKDNTGKRQGDIWLNCSDKNLDGNIWSSL